MLDDRVPGSPGARAPEKSAHGSDLLKTRVQGLIIRILDILFSLIGLIVMAPLFPIIVAFIKLESKGPAIYPAARVGQDQKIFPMYKFRTMLENADRINQSVCPHHDPRVTSVGRFLRRTKLNEFPQLFNVFKGDMSFVGPRPEAPDLAEVYPDEAKKVFSVKPGLVGPAVITSLKDGVSGRNEEELYPASADATQYYLERILPEKVKIDLYFLSRLTIVNYLKIILSALKETIFGSINLRQASKKKGQTRLLISDFALIQVSFALTYLLSIRTGGNILTLKIFLIGLMMTGVIRFMAQYGLGLYSFVQELVMPRDVFRVPLAVGLGSLGMLIINAFFRMQIYSPLFAAVDFLLLCVLLTGVRLFLLFRFRSHDETRAGDYRTRVFIFGANKRGLKAFLTLGGTKGPYEVVGFIDDDEAKYARKIYGLRVLGNRYHIKALSVLHEVQDIILAHDNDARDQTDEIVALCAQAGVRSQIFPTEKGGDGVFRGISYPLRPVDLSDMLPQVQVPLDEPNLRALLQDKTVLMYGSGAELGSSLCRIISGSGCRKIIIVDRFPSRLRENLAGLRIGLPGFQVVPVVLDGRETDVLAKIFTEHQPHIVIHAGMRKFVTLQRTDEDEVAGANFLRTFNLARVSGQHGCQFFVVISSIKATSRGNFISESLRAAEISLNAFFSRTPTRLIVTRVGNIIENRGGVASLINDHILEQKPILLPTETAETFLLSKKAAARSVLQSLVLGSKISPGGFLLTAEPGACLRLSDVARKIANLYGFKIGDDVVLKFNEIPSGLIDEERDLVISANHAPGFPLEVSLGVNESLLMIEDMISNYPRGLNDLDWHRWAEKVLSLYRSSPPSLKKDIFIN